MIKIYEKEIVRFETDIEDDMLFIMLSSETDAKSTMSIKTYLDKEKAKQLISVLEKYIETT